MVSVEFVVKLVEQDAHLPTRDQRPTTKLRSKLHQTRPTRKERPGQRRYSRLDITERSARLVLATIGKYEPLDPAPISPRRPFMLFSCNQVVASARRSAPMVVETQVSEVPEPSESRYWCISMATLSLGSCISAKASPLPDEVQVHAPRSTKESQDIETFEYQQQCLTSVTSGSDERKHNVKQGGKRSE